MDSSECRSFDIDFGVDGNPPQDSRSHLLALNILAIVPLLILLQSCMVRWGQHVNQFFVLSQTESDYVFLLRIVIWARTKIQVVIASINLNRPILTFLIILTSFSLEDFIKVLKWLCARNNFIIKVTREMKLLTGLSNSRSAKVLLLFLYSIFFLLLREFHITFTVLSILWHFPGFLIGLDHFHDLFLFDVVYHDPI